MSQASSQGTPRAFGGPTVISSPDHSSDAPEDVFDVAVVGAGFGGLATALTLQGSGLRTILVEALDKVGGRAYTEARDGYLFDRGPTIITAPFLIDALFERTGARREDYVSLRPVDPFYDVVFDDGTNIAHWTSFERLLDDVARISPSDVEGVRAFFRHSDRIFEKGFLELGDRSFPGLGSMLKVAPDLVRLDAVRPVHTVVSRYVRHPKVRQFLSFHPLLIGGNPFRAAAVYTLINRLERAYGVHHAVGGMGALAAALDLRFRELGGKTLLSAPVRQVRRSTGDSRGKMFEVMTPRGPVLARRLVVNADMRTFVENVLQGDARPARLGRKLRRSDYSMSAFLLYLGVKKTWPGMPQHSILLGPRYKSLLEDIFRKRVEALDYSLYLHLPTRTDPSLAPPGREVVYALVPVPNLGSGTDWDARGPMLAAHVREYLERKCLPGLDAHVETSVTFTPKDFESTLGSYAGNAFGLEPHLLQSAAFRPANRSSEVPGLYFVGACTQPGAGIPGVLLGSRMTCQALAADAGLPAPFAPLRETEAARRYVNLETEMNPSSSCARMPARPAARAATM